MRTVPNDIVSTLLRTLPIIIENVDAEALQKKLRLCNAVRLTKNIIQRLNKIEHEQSNHN